ncbi:MAG: aldehyde dehydrogenase family protein [Planctomycetes bacterium]|nr:aldehyde dehydrogenase family protein [Planctomycetota bacterium]
MDGKNYINGKFVASNTNKTFESRNPANTDDIIGTFPMSDEKDVNTAVEAASNAFPSWRSLSRIKRGEYVDAFTQIIKRDHEEISRLVARECGKGINESRADVTEGIHMVQYCFATTRMPFGDVVASEIAEKDSFMRRKPKGVVAAISPWNFPFAIPLWLIGPSITEGNTSILKPSSETPAVAHRMSEAFHEAGFPPGVINVIYGSGGECGNTLVKRLETVVVLFVGSYEVGAEIKKICAEYSNKMCACEMGGKNAIIVLDDADLDIAIKSAVISAFKTTGQRCTSTSRLIVHKKVLSKFEKGFVDMAKRMRIGDPLNEDVFMGPLINEASVKKVTSYNDISKKEGAEILLEGKRLTDKEYKKGCFMSPHIYRMEHDPKSRVLNEEVFGPHVAIIPVKDLDNAIEVYNSTEYGLCLSVITEDYRKVREVREQCEYGLGYVNLPTIGAEVHLPFGGVKKSGTGLPSASTLVDVVTHRTAWTVNNAREIKMPQGMKV